MRGSLNLGKIFGIRVLVHFSFLFIFIWVAYSGTGMGYSWIRIVYECLFAIAVFVCVLMHEFGHALAARRYGIDTKQILLLPIGGVAQLERMPEKPGQELVVAIMGPMVNVALLFILVPLIFIIYPFENLRHEEFWVMNILARLALINLALLVFNLIPAFPMDGGRILRALLTYKLGYRKATHIAARIGQLLAIGFFLLGIFNYNVLWVLIASFVFIGAEMEYRMVSRKESMRGYEVHEAMLSRFTVLRPEQSLLEAVKELLAGSDVDFLVMNDEGVAGILTRDILLKAVAEHGNEIKVAEVMMTDFPRLHPNQPIEDAAMMMRTYNTSVLPVVDNRQFLGVINLENIHELLQVRSSMGARDAKEFNSIMGFQGN